MQERHPVCRLIYFLSAVIITLCFMQPFMLCCSLAGAFVWRCLQVGARRAARNFALVLPLGLLAALINPLFNHRGATIVFYFPWGNPFTWESFVYGLLAALMIMSVLLWSLCFKDCFGSDALHAVMGKRLPRLALFFSLVFGFIPRLHEDMRAIDAAKRGIGEGVRGQGLKARLRYGAELFSSLLDRELDRSFDSAAQLAAGGYALQPRGFYTLFRFARADALCLCCMAAALLLMFALGGMTQPVFFPVLRFSLPNAAGAAGCLLFYTLPLLWHLYEVLKWKRLNAAL